MSKGAPATPNYQQAAQQTADSQAQAQRDATYANRVNTTTPWGGVNYTTGTAVDPSTGKNETTWNQNVTLSPAQQSALTSQQNIQQGQSGIAQGLLAQEKNDLNQGPPNVPGISQMGGTPTLQNGPQSGPNLQTGVGAPGAFNNDAANAVYSQYQHFNQPGQQQAQDSQVAQLNAQGLKPGDAAYDKAMSNLNLSQEGQNANAQQAAVSQGNQVGATNFNEAVAGGNFANNAAQQAFGNAQNITSNNNQVAQAGFSNNQNQTGFNNTAAQQALSQELQRRGFTMNEINGVLNGQQVANPGSPTTYNQGATQGTNFTGALQNQYSANLNSSNAANANISGGVGAASSIASLF